MRSIKFVAGEDIKKGDVVYINLLGDGCAYKFIQPGQTKPRYLVIKANGDKFLECDLKNDYGVMTGVCLPSIGKADNIDYRLIVYDEDLEEIINADIFSYMKERGEIEYQDLVELKGCSND